MYKEPLLKCLIPMTDILLYIVSEKMRHNLFIRNKQNYLFLVKLALHFIRTHPVFPPIPVSTWNFTTNLETSSESTIQPSFN